MPERTKIVSAMLRLVRQISVSNEFARDAAAYAEMARDNADHDAAGALRAIVRKVEVIQMRRILSRLATRLSALPIEGS